MPLPFGNFQHPKWEPPSFLRPKAQQPASFTPSSVGEGPIIDVTPDTVEIRSPAATATYSNIDLEYLVRHKFFSVTPAGTPPEVTEMRVRWLPFEHREDHTVRLLLALSKEQRAHLDEHGYYDDPVGEEPLVDETIMQELLEAQEAEIASATDPIIKGALLMEHEEQLKEAKERKIPITPDHLLRYPFERTFSSRIEATRYRSTVERYLQKLRIMLKNEKSD